MKIPDPLLPSNPDSPYARELNFKLVETLRRIVSKVNLLGDGRSSAIDNQATAAPTSGAWAQGDSVKNSAPSELGVAGNKYVIEGWLCTAGGTPGTWVQKRFLTGN